ALGSKDGREVALELHAMHEQGLLTRLADGGWALKEEPRHLLKSSALLLGRSFPRKWEPITTGLSNMGPRLRGNDSRKEQMSTRFLSLLTLALAMLPLAAQGQEL